MLEIKKAKESQVTDKYKYYIYKLKPKFWMFLCQRVCVVKFVSRYSKLLKKGPAVEASIIVHSVKSEIV